MLKVWMYPYLEHLLSYIFIQLTSTCLLKFSYSHLNFPKMIYGSHFCVSKLQYIYICLSHTLTTDVLVGLPSDILVNSLRIGIMLYLTLYLQQLVWCLANSIHYISINVEWILYTQSNQKRCTISFTNFILR